MKTWDEIASEVNRVEALCKAWEDDDQTPLVEYEGRNVRAVSQQLDRAWSELYDGVCGPEVEPEAYELVMALDAWIDCVDRFRDDTRANPGGTDAMWKAWTEVLAFAKRKPVAQMLEGICYLSRVQKCSPSQIAKIYEWKDEFGQPDTRRVLAVIESGNEEPVVSPHWQRQRERIAEKWEARESRVRQTVAEPIKVDKAAPKIAPESIETLLEQNVSSRQIARMKNIDQQTVLDYARELGLPVDGQQPPPAMTPEQHLSRVRETENQRLAEAKAYTNAQAEKQRQIEKNGGPNTYTEIGNYKEQVRQMALDGCSKQQIVQGLQAQHPEKCKPSSVAQIMAALEREVAASQE